MIERVLRTACLATAPPRMMHGRGRLLTHVTAVIVTEIYEGGGITSAMFTGRKILNRSPQDVGR